jgi:hypothetical protein
MPEQLALIDHFGAEFRLDQATREVGRRGVAEARRVLTEVVRAAEERAERERRQRRAEQEGRPTAA